MVCLCNSSSIFLNNQSQFITECWLFIEFFLGSQRACAQTKLLMCAIFFASSFLNAVKMQKGDTNDDAKGFSKDPTKIEKHNFSAEGKIK